MTYQEFAEKHGITLTYAKAFVNPHMDDMPKGSFHYAVTLRKGDLSLFTHYSKGPEYISNADEIKRAKRIGAAFIPGRNPVPPDVAEVLCSLAMESASYDGCDGLKGFCRELCYPEDGVKARDIYHACGENAKALRRMLGRNGYDELLGCEE